MRNVDELLQELNNSTLTRPRLVLREGAAGSAHILERGDRHMRQEIEDALKFAAPVGIVGVNAAGKVEVQVAPEATDPKAAEKYLRSLAAA